MGSSILLQFFFFLYEIVFFSIFQSLIGTVERNINGMLQFQSHSKNLEARDYALLVDNNGYVQNWSLIQIIVILLTCSIQVTKLFYYDIRT